MIQNKRAALRGQLGLDQEMIALVAHVDAERFGRSRLPNACQKKIVVPAVVLGTAGTLRQ